MWGGGSETELVKRTHVASSPMTSVIVSGEVVRAHFFAGEGALAPSLYGSPRASKFGYSHPYAEIRVIISYGMATKNGAMVGNLPGVERGCGIWRQGSGNWLHVWGGGGRN